VDALVVAIDERPTIGRCGANMSLLQGWNYSRLWPSRGDDTFAVQIGYFESVLLIALAGVIFALAVLCNTCFYTCYRKCKCRCCRRTPSRPYVRSKHTKFVVFEASSVLRSFTGTSHSCRLCAFASVV
jgi:hypothetical protein